MQAPVKSSPASVSLTWLKEPTKAEFNQISRLFSATFSNQNITFTSQGFFFTSQEQPDRQMAAQIIKEGVEKLEAIHHIVESMPGILPAVEELQIKVRESWQKHHENPTVANRTFYKSNLDLLLKIHAMFERNIKTLNALLMRLKRDRIDIAAYRLCCEDHEIERIKTLHVSYCTQRGQTDLMSPLEKTASKINNLVTTIQKELLGSGIQPALNPLRELGCSIDLEVFGKICSDRDINIIYIYRKEIAKVYFVSCIPENVDLAKLRTLLSVAYPDHNQVKPLLRTLVQRSSAKRCAKLKGIAYLRALYKIDKMAGSPWIEDSTTFINITEKPYASNKWGVLSPIKGNDGLFYYWDEYIFADIGKDYSINFYYNERFYSRTLGYTILNWPDIFPSIRRIREVFTFKKEWPELFARAEKILPVLKRLIECRLLSDNCLEVADPIARKTAYYLSKTDVSINTIEAPPPFEGKSPRQVLGDAVAAWHFKGLLTSEQRLEQYGLAILSLCRSNQTPGWTPDEFGRMILTGFEDTIQADPYQKPILKNEESERILYEQIMMAHLVIYCEED